MAATLFRLPALLGLQRAYAESVPVGPKQPHVVFILQDDLGLHDIGIYGNEEAEYYTGNLTALARNGTVLNNFHAYYTCSPTRRSFLTGRLPLHHTEESSGFQADAIDLRWSWISDKLEAAGYVSFWYGKGHIGHRSMNHLPARHGFNGDSLFFDAGQSYTDHRYWSGEEPWQKEHTYSTDLFGALAVKAIREQDPNVPMFLYLAFQAVCIPYELPPESEGCYDAGNHPIPCMMRSVDNWVGKMVAMLHDKGMYEDTLIIYSSDNGGVQKGNNHPLRGEKNTNWQGAFQVPAFVSGGYLPSSVRGSINNILFHIADLYPTLCRLAGVDGSDDPSIPPLPVDVARPELDVYRGGQSFPPVDGHDIWDQLVGSNATSPWASLWLSRDALRRGRYKLVVAQPNGADGMNNGWKSPQGEWLEAAEHEWPCNARRVNKRSLRQLKPCLFDLEADPREQRDLASALPDLVQEMWSELNRSNLGSFTSRSPAALLGVCNEQCAKKRWSGPGPICWVPGCSAPPEVGGFVGQERVMAEESLSAPRKHKTLGQPRNSTAGPAPRRFDSWVRWLHVPKTGQSFAIPMFGYGCPRHAQKYVESLLKSVETGGGSKIQRAIAKYPLDEHCDPRRVAVDPTAWRHVAVRPQDVGHIVVMLRDPRQRAWSHLMQFLLDSTGTKFRKNRGPRRGKGSKRKSGSKGTEIEIRKAFVEMLRLQSGKLMGNCQRTWKEQDVIRRISGPDVVFVGILEHWNLSILLLHAILPEFPMRREELLDIHPSSTHLSHGNSTVGGNAVAGWSLPSYLANTTNDVEEALYAAGKIRFFKDVDAYLK